MMEECVLDMCLVLCFGFGDLKCGGYGNYFVVYILVDVWFLSLRLFLDVFV